MSSANINHNISVLKIWVDDFWAFSGKVYGLPNMQAHCIAWQDQYHGHVNGLLFAIWCDVRGYRVLSADNLQQLNTVIVHSHDNDVAPIRQVRLAHSDKSSTDYKAALSTELAAEQRQQEAIIQWALTHLNDQPLDTNDGNDKDIRLQQTRLYLHGHIANNISDQALKNGAIALTKDIESIAQRALPSV
jgi:uncharacterized protein (TIGR02444 family)